MLPHPFSRIFINVSLLMYLYVSSCTVLFPQNSLTIFNYTISLLSILLLLGISSLFSLLMPIFLPPDYVYTSDLGIGAALLLSYAHFFVS